MNDVSSLNQINMLLNDHLKDAPDAKSRENAARLIAAFTACRSFERQAHEAADVIDRLGLEVVRLNGEIERLKAAAPRPEPPAPALAAVLDDLIPNGQASS